MVSQEKLFPTPEREPTSNPGLYAQSLGQFDPFLYLPEQSAGFSSAYLAFMRQVAADSKWSDSAIDELAKLEKFQAKDGLLAHKHEILIAQSFMALSGDMYEQQELARVIDAEVVKALKTAKNMRGEGTAGTMAELAVMQLVNRISDPTYRLYLSPYHLDADVSGGWKHDLLLIDSQKGTATPIQVKRYRAELSEDARSFISVAHRYNPGVLLFAYGEDLPRQTADENSIERLAPLLIRELHDKGTPATDEVLDEASIAVLECFDEWQRRRPQPTAPTVANQAA